VCVCAYALQPTHCYVSQYWWEKHQHMSAPGPCSAAVVMCDHGHVKRALVEQVERLVVRLTRAQWDTLSGRYGAGPVLTSLEPCVHCEVRGLWRTGAWRVGGWVGGWVVVVGGGGGNSNPPSSNGLLPLPMPRLFTPHWALRCGFTLRLARRVRVSHMLVCTGEIVGFWCCTILCSCA
jgi:hypothetical protein